MPLRDTIDRLRPSVFEICQKSTPHGVTTFECIGTGFLIADNWIATCHHVVDGLQDGEVAVRYHLAVDNMEASGSFNIIAVHRYKNEDVALINARQVVGRPHVPVVVGRAVDSWVGETIFSAGYPLGFDMQETNETRVVMVTTGIAGNLVFDVNPRTLRHYVLDMTAHPGCSGSPVFTAERGVIGMLNAGHPAYVASSHAGAADTRVGVGYARAIPIETVARLLATHGVATAVA